MGSAIGATIPTTFGQTKCNVLVDTGAMKSCMSQAYYEQLMLPTTRPIHTYQVKSANGSNLYPIGITECEFKIGQKEYKNDFVVCKNLIRPCISGIDFLKKHGIFAGWTPTGKFKLISQQEFLVESLEVLMKGPMIHNKQGVEIPGRSMVIIKTSIDTRECPKDQVSEVQPNFLLPVMTDNISCPTHFPKDKTERKVDSLNIYCENTLSQQGIHEELFTFTIYSTPQNQVICTT